MFSYGFYNTNGNGTYSLNVKIIRKKIANGPNKNRVGLKVKINSINVIFNMNTIYIMYYNVYNIL